MLDASILEGTSVLVRDLGKAPGNRCDPAANRGQSDCQREIYGLNEEIKFMEDWK